MSRRDDNLNSYRIKGIKAVLKMIVQDARRKSSVPFILADNGGFRSVELQQKLYAQGRTTPGNIVTWVDGIKKTSAHQTGDAFDVLPRPGGVSDTETFDNYLAISNTLKATAKEYGVELQWGYDLWGKDMPHFQIAPSDRKYFKLLQGADEVRKVAKVVLAKKKGYGLQNISGVQ